MFVNFTPSPDLAALSARIHQITAQTPSGEPGALLRALALVHREVTAWSRSRRTALSLAEFEFFSALLQEHYFRCDRTIEAARALTLRTAALSIEDLPGSVASRFVRLDADHQWAALEEISLHSRALLVDVMTKNAMTPLEATAFVRLLLHHTVLARRPHMLFMLSPKTRRVISKETPAKLISLNTAKHFRTIFEERGRSVEIVANVYGAEGKANLKTGFLVRRGLTACDATLIRDARRVEQEREFFFASRNPDPPLADWDEFDGRVTMRSLIGLVATRSRRYRSGDGPFTNSKCLIQAETHSGTDIVLVIPPLPELFTSEPTPRFVESFRLDPYRALACTDFLLGNPPFSVDFSANLWALENLERLVEDREFQQQLEAAVEASADSVVDFGRRAASDAPRVAAILAVAKLSMAACGHPVDVAETVGEFLITVAAEAAWSYRRK